MIRKHIYQDRKIAGIKKIDAYEGELIETKVKRITVNEEPIKDGAPLVYTEKKTEYYHNSISVQTNGI